MLWNEFIGTVKTEDYKMLGGIKEGLLRTFRDYHNDYLFTYIFGKHEGETDFYYISDKKAPLNKKIEMGQYISNVNKGLNK